MGIIRFLALGAGQDVGRSCVIVTVGGRTIMFDCGMHMGYNDERRFPDFTLLSPAGGDLCKIVDCVIITHFHLDHCGALPYLTEMCGYTGPIFMTHPTKALCPILLEDFRRIAVERKGESNFFTPKMISDCMKKVVPLTVLQSHRVQRDEDFFVKPYYAGHVMGAAMFYVKVGSESVLYTGDYNMTPDRHLGAAEVDLDLQPDVLITESTYATTLRDSKRAREREFLKNIHQCVAAGGKVLIPVFALGRVQELCILVEAYWERHGLQIPIYFSAGMAETANAYYKSYIGWTNERGVEELPVRNMFDFRHVKQFEKHLADTPGPMVLFSSPGMLHSGTSLEIFKKWCGDERNLLIIPGFCVSGTVGAKLLSGQRRIELEDTKQVLDVKIKVKNMSFSAHADARGIMQLIKTSRPRNVVLVHGEAQKMAILKSQIVTEMGVPCFDPPNGQLLLLESSWEVPVRLDARCVEETRMDLERVRDNVLEGRDNLEELDADEEDILMSVIRARADPKIPFSSKVTWSPEDAIAGRPITLCSCQGSSLEGETVVTLFVAVAASDEQLSLPRLGRVLQRELAPYIPVLLQDGAEPSLQIRSINLKATESGFFLEWKIRDTDIVTNIVNYIESRSEVRPLLASDGCISDSSSSEEGPSEPLESD